MHTPALNEDNRGVSSTAVVIGVAIVASLCVALFYISNHQAKTNQPAATPPPPSSLSTDQSSVVRIPEDYAVYTSKDYAFAFAYPKTWGDVTGSKTTGAAYVVYSKALANLPLGSDLLNGQLAAFVYPKDQFKIATHTDGAQVTAVKLGDTYGWKVVQTGAADPKLAVGDDYTVQSATYQANVTVYDFTTTENNKIQGRWVFESGDNFIVVTLPVLSRADGTVPSSTDRAAYTAIGTNMAKTMRPTK